MKYIKSIFLVSLAITLIYVSAAASKNKYYSESRTNNFSICKHCLNADTTRPTQSNKIQKANQVKSSKAETTISKTLQEDGVDPVCHMKVKKGATLISVYKGKQYGFCNPSCKDRFDKKPDSFIK